MLEILKILGNRLLETLHYIRHGNHRTLTIEQLLDPITHLHRGDYVIIYNGFLFRPSDNPYQFHLASRTSDLDITCTYSDGLKEKVDRIRDGTSIIVEGYISDRRRIRVRDIFKED